MTLPGLKILKDAFNDVASVIYQHSQKLVLFPMLKHQLETGRIDHAQAAFKIAESVHRFAKRRSGDPYMNHVDAVVSAPDHYVEIQYNDNQRMIARTHDAGEDSRGAWRLADFRKLKFPEEYIAGQDGVTHRKNELYLDFIERCSMTPGAAVKCADNLRNWSDNPKPLREKLYRVSYHYLRAVITGRIEAGSSIADFAVANGLYDRCLFERYSARPLVDGYAAPSDKTHMAGIRPPAQV